ncbi:acyltransferase [Sphingomicrobium aestuariivivum]|uniref:acyltransferase n=1 Tax=Sphingomicrobium aestuariivivum TaxID=1582356 RepID=UPI001FD66329|nr:acyltransferase [Sphingomicrobium aestuariivivum]MCJ8191959.1 acyltransferase [Sphingomicrobium aestuariivivum]
MAMLPATRGFAFKRWLLRRAGASVGNNVRICSSARFGLTGRLEIGEGTWLGHEFLLVGGDAEVSIGRDCDIAPRVTFAMGSHELMEGGNRAAGAGFSEPILVGEGCWIGTGATLLGGTSIGKASVVAAGALVRGDFSDRVLIGGVPAPVIRKPDRKAS